MIAYILRRLSALVVILFGSSFIIYNLSAISGDPLEALRISQDPNAAQQIITLTRDLQLDVPPPLRYFLWLKGVLGAFVGQVDFGMTRDAQSVTDAVAAAIPIIRPLRESLAGDKVTRIMGIVNGSTNYILDRMHADGLSLEAAMAEATDLGYLEADPSLDVEGYDAAQKVAILASLAFHTEVDLNHVHREGITGITREQMQSAKENGYVIKLLAVCEKIEADEQGEAGVSARVYPALIPTDHPLASVRKAFNAVFVEAEAAGELMFYGAGAGGAQTASAVLGDLVSAAKRHVIGGPGLADSAHANLPTLPISRITTSYQIALEVKDQPGVLAEVANIFANHNVSVETVEQSIASKRENPTAQLLIGTHDAKDSALTAVVQALSTSNAVDSITSVIRVEGN